MKKQYSITGKVLELKSRIAIPGLRVEAWDMDLIFDDLVGSTETNRAGEFTFSFNEDYFKELFFDRRPDLFFRVFYNNIMVLDTGDQVIWNLESENQTIELFVSGVSVGMPDTGETPPVIPGLKLDVLAGILDFDAALLKKLAAKDITIDNAGEATLTALMTDNTITPAQKKDLQLTVSLAQLSGENIELTKALKKVTKESSVELVRWNRADWLKFIKDKKIKLPEGETDFEAYSENLRDVVEKSFPSEYFLHRVVNGEARATTGVHLNTIAPLFKNNPTVIPASGEAIEYDWKDISAANKLKIETGIAEITPLLNSYQALGLTDILNHPEKSAEQKQKAVENRFVSLGTFYSNNPGVDLMYADFASSNSETQKDNWNWNGVDAADQPYVKKQMAAAQRAFTIGGNHETGDLLMKKGYNSSLAITAVGEDEFLKISGLNWETGKVVYAKAQETALASSHYFEAIRDITRGSFRNIAMNNQDTGLVNDLKEIDGYAALFGNQDFCECDACKSVLSPAAYFTDLMYFVQEHVSKKLFIPSHTTHPLYLKRRRPDLWTLKLSCANTTTEIPYLQVVNEVLEKYLTQEIPTADVYETLRTSGLSVNQPFNLALEETRLFLSHFGITLTGIYKTLNQPKKEQEREYLLLSAEEVVIISTPDTAGAHKRFGNIPYPDFNVQEFIRLAGISRAALDDLLKTKFAPAIAAVKVKMVKIGTDIQQYREELTGLTAANLDIIHRYLRLWKKTNRTLREFDLLLCSFQSAGLLNNLEAIDGNGDPMFLQMAQAAAVQEKTGCSAEELATIIYRLPVTAIADNRDPFYNRIFDLKKIFGVAVVNAATTTTLPAIPANDKITPLILAGLGITESELEMLYELLGIDHSVDQTIGIDMLSALYRHALLARGLKLSIEDFVHLLALIPGGGAITQLAQVEILADTISWRKTAPFSVSEMRLIIKGEESSDLLFANTIHVAAAAVAEIQTSAAADKKDKKDLLKAYLQRTFNLNTDQLDNAFFPNLLSLNLSSPEITTALNASFTNGKPDNAADLDGLLTLMHELERFSILFQKAQFDADMISFFVNNKAVFGIADLQNLTPDALVNASRYYNLLHEKKEQSEAINLVLQNVQASGTFGVADNTTLADVWMQPESLITSLTGALSFAPVALEAIGQLQDALQVCITLGLQGDALVKLTESDKAGLLAARNVVVGAFASKYPEEKIRNEKAESYNDKLNTLKRDALCDYIISRSDKFKFKDRNDLYNFFLLDVEMSGCFRTSYLVAAITSVQHYIHRCLINLEQSDNDLNPNIPNLQVIPGWIPGDEWEWRKNYRVWEANRKVFLYPENYIDPTLRDNKTEIFKTLEDELLQQKITKESAETAYKKYLAQFAELTRLRYAGGYYNKVSNGLGFLDLGNARENTATITNSFYYVSGIAMNNESDESMFYLFARTNTNPYKYSYRTYNHYKKVWTSWKTIELAIEAGEISSIIYQGKLYIYWTEVQGKEINKIKDGNTTADGFVFKAHVKYAFLDENGKWSAPQRLYIGQNHVSEETVFRRVWNGAYPDPPIREKAHDTTVEKFQELVFRKPYATRVSNIKQPIALHHIWSHNKSQSKVSYTTGDIKITLAYAFTISVPSQTFIVTNNDFKLAGRTVDATISYASLFNLTMPIKVKVSMGNSCQCTVRYDALDVDFVANVAYHQDLLNTPILTTKTTLSLSRNAVTNLSPADMLAGASGLTNIQQQEYNLVFSEDNSNGYKIESGKKSLSPHFVSQTEENDAALYVTTGSNLDHVTLSTILTDELGDILFAKGLEQFLSLTTQKLTDDYAQSLDFNGAYGDYYWEMFFHVPFLIADHLNANQKFKEAKWWYERIFNPTANEQPGSGSKTEHNWQFREFRNLNIAKLKDILTDNKAIEAYKKDPFNPHAIARLRLSAYQKTIVMHYIDNLLDWGDYLFTQDTRESINEAEMLYQLAFDILGKRPVKTGKCETTDEDNLTYANLEPQIGKGSEFLIQLENYHWVIKQTYTYQKEMARVSKRIQSMTMKKAEGQKSFAEIARKSQFTSMSSAIGELKMVFENPATTLLKTDSNASRVMPYKKVTAAKAEARENLVQWKDQEQFIFGNESNDRFKTKLNRRLPGMELVKQYSTAFCVPPNADLMKYWDRVEDRLFKIRNCMNIKGIRRSLSLFQPPIDPMLLVRARAAGLSLEDISALVGGGTNLPAYRFSYLIEKAKQFTQTLQSFGSALLSALEKKDGEELTMLRSVHEKNILKLTKTVKRKQVQDAQYQYKAAEAALVNVQNRIDYYQGLIDTGLIPWEITEQVSKWTSGSIKVGVATLEFLSSAFGFLPQVGSPFAMKYGGHELFNGMKGLSAATDTLATIADNIAILAGLEASHQRREQDWNQQLKLAQQEIKQSNIQLLAADIKQQIAEHDLLIHEKNTEQTAEVFDFYKNKFTNLGLYNYMASTLNRLYRNAYNMAYELAKQAEQAYQHELYDSEIYIQADNWQFDRAGLLAGERLMLQLQEMEHKFISNNVRRPEITQTFSLAMLSPLQLLKLRQTGSCEIVIPEIAFEVLYPGQFRRTIKSVRVTIPCVAGQYTNISALLTLTNGSIEREENAIPVPLDVAKNTSISASSASNDAGVFDFNFRDERYLPFEGGGAISEWRLELPAHIRAFNYDTISDVLLHISYTAYESNNRSAAENALATLVTDYGNSDGYYRLVSMRYEFPETLHKLFSQNLQTADFKLTASHFPFLFSTKTLTIATTQIYLKPKKGLAAPIAPPATQVNGAAVTWSASDDIPAIGGTVNDTIKGGTVTLSNSPVKTWTINTGNGGLNKNEVEDILILVKYKTS